jgi:hypothetical protein
VSRGGAPSFDLAHEEFQRLGQRVLDSMWEAVRRGQEDPILPSARGHEIRALLDEPLPREGIAVDEVMDVTSDAGSSRARARSASADNLRESK